MVCLCVQPSQEILNQLAYFHWTFYENYTTSGHSTFVLLNFLPSEISWKPCKLLRLKQHWCHLMQSPKIVCSNISLKTCSFVKVVFLQNIKQQHGCMKHVFSFPFDSVIRTRYVKFCTKLYYKHCTSVWNTFLYVNSYKHGDSRKRLGYVWQI